LIATDRSGRSLEPNPFPCSVHYCENIMMVEFESAAS
jgi:hypothetical protein